VDEEPERLVFELRAGSRAAFEAIYRLYRAPVFGFLLRLSGDRGVAEDLFQNTWLKLHRHAQTLRPDSDLKAWLFTVARNEYLSHRRWRSLDVRRLAGAELRPSVPVSSDVSVEFADLERGLAKLNRDEREVLLLSVVEGFEPVRAAGILGISHAAFRKRLSRARTRLERLLAEQMP